MHYRVVQIYTTIRCAFSKVLPVVQIPLIRILAYQLHKDIQLTNLIFLIYGKTNITITTPFFTANTQFYDV